MSSHGRGLAALYLRFDAVEQIHARPAGREISLDLGIPLKAVPFGKPIEKGSLLFARQPLDRVLDIGHVHIGIIPRSGPPAQCKRHKPPSGTECC